MSSSTVPSCLHNRTTISVTTGVEQCDICGSKRWAITPFELSPWSPGTNDTPAPVQESTCTHPKAFLSVAQDVEVCPNCGCQRKHDGLGQFREWVQTSVGPINPQSVAPDVVTGGPSAMGQVRRVESQVPGAESIDPALAYVIANRHEDDVCDHMDAYHETSFDVMLCPDCNCVGRRKADGSWAPWEKIAGPEANPFRPQIVDDLADPKAADKLFGEAYGIDWVFETTARNWGLVLPPKRDEPTWTASTPEEARHWGQTVLDAERAGAYVTREHLERVFPEQKVFEQCSKPFGQRLHGARPPEPKARLVSEIIQGNMHDAVAYCNRRNIAEWVLSVAPVTGRTAIWSLLFNYLCKLRLQARQTAYAQDDSFLRYGEDDRARMYAAYIHAAKMEIERDATRDELHTLRIEYEKCRNDLSMW